MKKKVKEFFENLTWNVKAFLYQPIIPVKPLEWVIFMDGSYDGESDKYVFYCIKHYKNYKDGYTVKVKKAEHDAVIAAIHAIFEEEN